MPAALTRSTCVVISPPINEAARRQGDSTRSIVRNSGFRIKTTSGGLSSEGLLLLRAPCLQSSNFRAINDAENVWFTMSCYERVIASLYKCGKSRSVCSNCRLISSVSVCWIRHSSNSPWDHLHTFRATPFCSWNASKLESVAYAVWVSKFQTPVKHRKIRKHNKVPQEHAWRI